MKDKKKKSFNWDEVYNKFHGKRLSVWREIPTPFLVNKIEWLKYHGVKNILDAGCGDGRNFASFAKSGFKITGLDISASAIKKCQDLCKKYHRVKLQQCSLEKLEKLFKKNYFDAIICDFVLVHLPQTEKVINAFYKLLKTGGYALLEFTSTKDPHFGKGKKIKNNQYLHKGIFFRYFTILEIEKLLRKFKVLTIDSEYSDNPDHGSGYNRRKRHFHHSYFVLAQKE